MWECWEIFVGGGGGGVGVDDVGYYFIYVNCGCFRCLCQVVRLI